MSGVFTPEAKEATPSLFSGEARRSFVLALVPKGAVKEICGATILELVVSEFSRHNPRLLADALMSELLSLETSHGFMIRGAKTCLSAMYISRP